MAKVKNLLDETAKVPSLRIFPVGGFLIRNLPKIYQRYTDIVQIRLGITEFYLVMNPELIQEVLVASQRSFIKGAYLQRTKKVFGEGLLTSEGDFHHRQRRLVQPAFHQDRIRAYAKIMTAYAERMMSNWRDGETLDIHNEMTKLTMAIVAKCLFDADIESESKAIIEDLATTIEYFNRLSGPLSAILGRLPTNEKYERAIRRIDRLIYDLIAERRSTGRGSGDLMSTLLDAKDEHGIEMTDQQLRDEILILFAAGHETTANALTWTWYLLSENPNIAAKLHDEVDKVIKAGSLPEPEDVPNLEYTNKVLTESMRIYPPAWILVRQAVEDSYIGKYFIPRGAQVVISQYVNHHDPRSFPNPEKFDPDRWNPELKRSLPKFAYFPFGGGPRSCVGEPFAWMEGVLLLAAISRGWNLHHIEGHKVEMLPRITLRPKYGMKMRLRRRKE